MDWNAISAVADLLASIGVIVSLVYVAIQIKQNSKVTSTANYQHIMDYQGTVLTSIIENPEVANIYNRGLKSFSDLSEDEKSQFHMMMSMMLTGAQMNYQLFNRGLMEEEIYAGQADSYLNFLENPGVLEWWQSAKQWFHKDYVRHLDEQVQRART